MGLLVTSLSLADFRSFERLSLSPAPTTTILVGPNAAGKTNTVEALQLLTAGASFRRPRPRDLVREGADSARIDARLEGDGRVLDARCDVVAGRRSFSLNGKRCRVALGEDELEERNRMAGVRERRGARMAGTRKRLTIRFGGEIDCRPVWSCSKTLARSSI